MLGAIFQTASEVWIPVSLFIPTYDLDGNLTNDGRWSYTCHDENRLLFMITTSSAVTMGVPNVDVYSAYDYGSRRVGKRIVDKRTTPAQTKIVSYAYDDWNSVATWERSSFASAPVLKQTYLWGVDLGSSGKADFGGRLNLQQAGRVGGLISSTHYNSPLSKEHHLPSYDANGNIIAWSGGTGPLLRKVDYDAFGNEVLVEDFGVTTKLPELGFSTKIKDAETGLSYYGYRYYDPKTGRWPSRDPIEEEGGLNLYRFVGNKGVDRFDVLGMSYEVKAWAGAYLSIRDAAFASDRNEFGIGISAMAEGEYGESFHFISEPKTTRVLETRILWNSSLVDSKGPTFFKIKQPGTGCSIDCYSWEQEVNFSQNIGVPKVEIPLIGGVSLGNSWTVKVKLRICADGDYRTVQEWETTELVEALGKSSFGPRTLSAPVP